MKKLLIAIGLVFLLGNGADMYPKRLVVTTDDGRQHVFQIDIADTNEKAARGLMFRTSMPSDAGMLFVSDKSRVWSMWMKNTLIPLDMIFFDDVNEVVYIKENAAPYSLDLISYPFPTKGVLELNGGTVRRLGIKPGDQLTY